MQHIIEDPHDFGLNRSLRTIYLHHLGGENSINWQTSSRLIKNLDILESDGRKPITIKMITSDGGDLADGFAMYSAIKNSPCRTHIIGYGAVCSAATIIMQAANKRSLTRESEFMIHHGSVWLDQTSIAARSTIQSSTRYNKIMLDIYASRCKDGPFFTERKYSQSRVKSYLENKMKSEGDCWITAEQSLDMGFIDEII
jgi:ATP-dependent protease ClpP protease subunit